MEVTKFKTRWVRRDRCLSDEKRQKSSAMPWDVVVLKLTCDDGTEGIAAAMVARPGQVTEGHPQKTTVPLTSGRNSHNREAIFYGFRNLDRHEVFYSVFLPGPANMALWDICIKKASLPLHRYMSGCRGSLPVYASSLFYDDPKVYTDETLHYRLMGISCYRVHPSSPVEEGMEIHWKLREAAGGDMGLISDPVGECTSDGAIRVGRRLEELNYIWFEEPFRNFELYKYQKPCQTLDIPIAAIKTARGAHWSVTQSTAQNAADTIWADVLRKCGITGTLKIAHIIDTFGLNCEICTTTTSYIDLINLYVSYTIHNCEYFEYLVPKDSFRFPTKGDLPIKDGRIYVLRGLGIGAELDWSLIRDNCVTHKVKTLDRDFIK